MDFEKNVQEKENNYSPKTSVNPKDNEEDA